MRDRSCKICRFYMPNVGMRGEPYCDRLKKWIGTTLWCIEWQPKKPQTNADRIRSMTDEELAEFISGKARTFGEEYEGYMSALDWLKQEVTTNSTT